MKRIHAFKSLVALSILSFLLFSCGKDQVAETTPQAAEKEKVTPGSDEGEIIANQYIVLLKDEVIKPATAYIEQPFATREEKSQFMKEKATLITAQIQQFLSTQDINTTQVIAYYTAVVSGFAAQLSPEEYEKLSANDKVDLIEHDRVETLPPFVVESVDNGAARAQSTPCGISNAGGSANRRSGKLIWIVDSGIDLDHPDLNVNTSRARSFVGGNANDCNGHGTHVAGTAAAKNNSIGVVGVARGASVVPVRVFKCSGGSPTSTIISGLNYVANNDRSGDVVNLSLGGYYGSNCSSRSSYRSVLNRIANGGTHIAIAAGNSRGNAALYQPACVNGSRIVTVASMTCSRRWSSFSNYGRGPIDFIATGSSVRSTYKNGGYATLSGTSMAAPHVAGIMHLRNGRPRGVGSVNRNGVNYPIARR